MLNEYEGILGELREKYRGLKRTESRLMRYIRALEDYQLSRNELEELDVNSEQHKESREKAKRLEIKLSNLRMKDNSLPFIEPKFYELPKGLKLTAEDLAEIVNKLCDRGITPTHETIYGEATSLNYQLTPSGLELTKKLLRKSVILSAIRKGYIYSVKVGNTLVYYPKDKEPLLEPIEEAIAKIVSESDSRGVESTRESIREELTSLGYPMHERTLNRKIHSTAKSGLIGFTFEGKHYIYYPPDKEPLVAEIS